MQLDERLVHAAETADIATALARLRDAVAAGVVLRDVRDHSGEPLVQLAIRLDWPELLDALLTHGCSIQEESQEGEESDDEDEDPNLYHGRAPLSLAVELGRDDCVCVLLAHGASVDVACHGDSTMETPLHVAALLHTTSQLKVMLPLSRAINAQDMADNTPLHLAATYDYLDAATALLSAGADVHATNASGATPLHCACQYGYTSMANLLLDHGADVDARDEQGATPLIGASQSSMGHFAAGTVLSLLVKRGADPNACTRCGESALFGAVRNGYETAVTALLDAGASVSQPTHDGDSILHTASRADVGSIEMWTRLLWAGADVHARDREGRTCYDIWIARPSGGPSQQSNSDPVAQLLQAAAKKRARPV